MLFPAFLLFISHATARTTISEVMTGNWSFKAIFPKDKISKIPNFNFIVKPLSIANYLQTSLNDEQIYINLSFVDLSGNITYQDKVYDFDFKVKAPPYISSDIDFGEYGLAHCTFANYISLHCAWVSENGDTFSIYGAKAPDARTFVQKYGMYAVYLVIVVVIILGFHHFTNKMQRDMAIEMHKKKLEDKKKQEEEKKKLLEKDGEKKEEEKGEEAKEEGEEKTGEEEEEEEKKEIKSAEKNKDGKYKTD